MLISQITHTTTDILQILRQNCPRLLLIWRQNLSSIVDVDQGDSTFSLQIVIMSKQEAMGNAGKKEQVKWTELMDTTFIQAMLKQQDIGNRINGTFTPQALNNMLVEFNTKLQMNLTKNHLKNRLKTIKIHFSQWYDMFRGTSLSGFSWNSDTQLIEAEQEVWERLTSTKPEAADLRTKKVANYNELLQLFAKDRASGAHAETAKERNAILDKSNKVKVETIQEVDELLAANEINLESPLTDDDIQVFDSIASPPEQPSSSVKYKSKKRKIELEDEPVIKEVFGGIKDVANAIIEGNKVLQRVYHHEYSGEEIFKQLEPMLLEPNEMDDAVMFLFRNQSDARLLFSYPVSLQKRMLQKMMGGA